MLEKRHVIVVGGGIGGVATALCFARAGTRVTLLERAPELREVGAGILVMSNGLAVLDGLGLAPELRSAGSSLARATLHTNSGQLLSVIPVPDFGAGFDRAILLRRSRLHEILLEAVRNEPTVTVRLGRTVTRAHQSGRVTFEGPEGSEALSGDLVVAADGVHSTVRRFGRFGARFRDLSALSVRGFVPMEFDALRELQEYWSPAGVFGGGPVGDGWSYFFTSGTKRPLPQAIAARDLEKFRATWRQAVPPVAPVVEAIERFDQLVVASIASVHCDRWVSDRLVLLGDAAHAMPPNLGQGGSSALLDAAVLVSELSHASSLQRGLRRYEQRRRPAMRSVQTKVDTLFALTEAPWPGVGPIRDAGAGLARYLPRRRSNIGLVQEAPDAMYRETAEIANPARRGTGNGARHAPAPVPVPVPTGRPGSVAGPEEGAGGNVGVDGNAID